MRIAKYIVPSTLFVGAALLSCAASAELNKGEPAPEIKAKDVASKLVDMDQLCTAKDRKLVILYFFSPNAGEEMANKLRVLHRRYGGKELEIVAVGMQQDKPALEKLSADLGIEYHVLNGNELGDAEWMKKIEALPLTLFVMATKERTIERVLSGGGKTQANLLKDVAENFFLQGDADAAVAIADQAIAAGEKAEAAKELKAYALATSGKLDDAEKEFSSINSMAGRAKVALERGEYTKALELAAQAPTTDASAQTVAAEAHLRKGETVAAEDAAQKAAQGEGADWQKSQAINIQGRIEAEKGNTDGAVKNYRESQALDPYNVIPLSNEADVHRKEGKLADAEKVLKKAAETRPSDQLSGIMLAQIQKQMEQQNDAERSKVIQTQIADLSKRFKEQKAAGAAAADNWTTRPLVMAFLPSRQGAGVFFERAGTDVALQREIEARLAAGNVNVVDRQMLDQLLQELNLGSSELASADTQRRLGKVLSAGTLGVIEFAQAGKDTMIYLRLIDSETTSIDAQISEPVDERAIGASVDSVSKKVLDALTKDHKLQGLIADGADAANVLINLGKKHGVADGQRFNVFEDGEPIQAGGRTIAHRQKKICAVVVTQVEDDYAVCKVEGDAKVALKKDMQIKAAS